MDETFIGTANLNLAVKFTTLKTFLAISNFVCKKVIAARKTRCEGRTNEARNPVAAYLRLRSRRMNKMMAAIALKICEGSTN